MHFYQFNIKEYHHATTHLTNEEDICYRRMLDIYYDTEMPLQESGLARKCKVTDSVAKQILSEFFTLTPEGWEHSVVKRELQTIYAKSLKARQSAEARWSSCERNANASDPHSERNANGMLLITDDALPKTKKKRELVQAPTDAEFWAEQSVRFPHINIQTEQARMEAWLSVNRGRKMTRKFAINWLNRVEAPLTTTPTKGKYDF